MGFAWAKTNKTIILATSAFSGLATYYLIDRKFQKVHNSWTTNWEPSICAKWDENWDQ